MNLSLNPADKPRRERAVLQDLLASETSSLAQLWYSLTSAEERIADAFFTSERCYLLLETVPRTSPHLAPRQKLILERVLRGECQKSAAIELGLGPSTVAVHAREALRFIGLDCQPSRCHPLAMAAAMAAVGGTPWWKAASSVIMEEGRALRVVSLARPEAALGETLPSAELDIVRCLVEGLCYREIAQRRKTSQRTVANQIASVSRRLRVSGRNELMCHLLTDSMRNLGPLTRSHDSARIGTIPPSEVHALVPRSIDSNQYA